MRPSHADRIALVLVGLLAVTAGCQSLGGATPVTEKNVTETDATETNTTQTNVTETNAVEANTTETNVTDANSSETESRAEANTTANALTESFADRHLQALRRAGNASVERTVSNPTDGDAAGPLLAQSRTAAASFDDGRFSSSAYLSSLSSGGVTYQTEDGNVFTISYDSGLTTQSTNGSVDMTAPFRLTDLNVTMLAHRGEGTVDGVNGTVYETSSFEAVGDDAFPGVNAENVTAFRATFVVDERGYAAYQKLNVTATRGNKTTRAVETVRITGVGSTTVERPGWVDRTDAKTESQ